MEAKEFGVFIATLRKEQNMTQAELAEKINVTDKAVSRWERGLGFPDINTLEPLAEALNISIVELMKTRRREEVDKEVTITEEDVSEILHSAEHMANYYSYYQKRQVVVLAGIFLFTVMILLFFVDKISTGVIFLLSICTMIGIASIYFLVRERKDERSCRLYVGLLCVFICVLIVGSGLIFPQLSLKGNDHFINTSVTWLMIVIDFVIVYDIITSAKKGELKWYWTVLGLIFMAAMLFWDVYTG